MIADLELLDKELTKDEITDKTGILDVKLRLKDGTTIDIEISFSDRRPCLSKNTRNCPKTESLSAFSVRK